MCASSAVHPRPDVSQPYDRKPVTNKATTLTTGSDLPGDSLLPCKEQWSWGPWGLPEFTVTVFIARKTSDEPQPRAGCPLGLTQQYRCNGTPRPRAFPFRPVCLMTLPTNHPGMQLLVPGTPEWKPTPSQQADHETGTWAHLTSKPEHLA